MTVATRDPRHFKFARLPSALTTIAAVLALAAQPAPAQSIKNGSLTVRLEEFHTFQASADEFAPTDMVQMPDGRFLTATLGGTVRLLDATGGLISTLMTPVETGTTKIDVTHYGMTSLNLHPDFDQPETFGYGKAYAMVTQQPESVTGVSADFTVPGSNPSMPFTNQDVVREYDLSPMLTSGVTSFVGQTVTARDIWRIDSPQASHNAFDIAFSSNGDMFIGSGDGGFTELGSNPLGPLHNRRQVSQDLDSAYGKILRINPDPNAYTITGGLNNQYSIPEGNPFVNTPGALPEVYANGVRSPYRINLDPNDPNEETLWLGDVGEGSREEVSKVVKGSNLGWGRFEGTNTSSGSITLDGNAHTPPEFQYSHSPRSLTGDPFSNYNEEAGGNSIVGGHIYRGTELGAEFAGLYVGANLGHHAGVSSWLPRLFYGDPAAAAVDLFKFDFDEFGQKFADDFLEAQDFAAGFDFEAAGLTPGEFDLPQLVLSIAEDNSGELYVLGVDFNGLGTISKIVRPLIPGDVDGMNGVDIEDFFIIRDNFNQAVAERGMGDLTGDNFVNLADYGQWQANVSASLAAAAAASWTIPEPTICQSLAAIVLAGGLFRRRTHHVAINAK